MKKINLIVSCILSVLSLHVNAQQEAQFTQYNDNMLYFNPAYAGSRDYMSMTAIHRQQWVGFEGAPISDCFSLHTPLKYESVALGISLLNDRLGPLNQTWFNTNFSYTLKFRNKTKLAFGLNSGLNVVNLNLSDLVTVDNNDPLFNQNLTSRILPNFGGGIYYHTKQFYAGLSVPRIIESKPKAGLINVNDQRHYYLSVGGYFKFNRRLKLRPSMMLKITKNAPLSLDASVCTIFYDRLWLGVNYRLLESSGFLAQIQLTQQIKIGYSFDVSTSRLVKYNYGTHEILLNYDLSFKKKKMLTTGRYFF